jgi:hypothetical protein
MQKKANAPVVDRRGPVDRVWHQTRVYYGTLGVVGAPFKCLREKMYTQVRSNAVRYSLVCATFGSVVKAMFGSVVKATFGRLELLSRLRSDPFSRATFGWVVKAGCGSVVKAGCCIKLSPPFPQEGSGQVQSDPDHKLLRIRCNVTLQLCAENQTSAEENGCV